jgi:hypothetical protein
MLEIAKNIGWAITYALIGGLLGTAMILAAASFIPRLLNRLTPNIDEAKEIAEGNEAVAAYFGRVTHAAILGISIVVAASIVAGLVIALA